jgi:hypothetical protein
MLTKLLIDSAKADAKPKRLTDGRGMYLESRPRAENGGDSSTA